MRINPKTKDAYQLMHDGTLALCKAEQAGIRVDMEYIERKKTFLDKKIHRLEKQLKDSKFFRHWQHTQKSPVNLYSNQQLAYYLYKVKKLQIDKKTISGQGATDEETLKQLNIPELDTLLQIRKLKKIKDVYLEGFVREQVKGYIHPFFNLHLVKTFRSSSDSPNFQNIPKRDEEAMQIVRKALYPRPGHQLIEIDFGALEVKIAACYHKDTTMLKYINDPTTDMHSDMTKQIFILDQFDKSDPYQNVLRQATKNGFVFPQFYGDYYKNCAINMACTWGQLPPGKWQTKQGIRLDAGPFFLSDHLICKGINSLKKFTDHIKAIEDDFWTERFSEYGEWKERWWKGYKRYGYLDMLTGFRCSGLMSKNDAINYPVQGAAFHCNLWTLIEADKAITKYKFDTRIIGQIHDSIILDANPNEVEQIIEIIQDIATIKLPKYWKWIIVPLEIDIDMCLVDGSWADKIK